MIKNKISKLSAEVAIGKSSFQKQKYGSSARKLNKINYKYFLNSLTLLNFVNW